MFRYHQILELPTIALISIRRILHCFAVSTEKTQLSRFESGKLYVVILLSVGPELKCFTAFLCI